MNLPERITLELSICDFLFILSDIERLDISRYEISATLLLPNTWRLPHRPRAAREVASGQTDVAHNNAADPQLTETHVLEVRRHAGQIPESSRANHQQVAIKHSLWGSSFEQQA